MERSDNDVSEGASATEPNRRTEGESVYRGVAEIVVNDDDWALAKEEETVNHDDSDNDDDIRHQPLKSTKWWSPWLPPAPKSDKMTLDRVELIDKRFIFALLTTTNG